MKPHRIIKTHGGYVVQVKGFFGWSDRWADSFEGGRVYFRTIKEAQASLEPEPEPKVVWESAV